MVADLLVVVPLLALGVCLVVATFRGVPPRWVMVLCAVCLAAFLSVLGYGLVSGLVRSRGLELLPGAVLAVLLAATLALVVRWLAQPDRHVPSGNGRTRSSSRRA